MQDLEHASAIPRTSKAIFRIDEEKTERDRGIVTYTLRVDELFRELEHTIALLSTSTSIESIALLSKLYVIAWVTLSDVIANLINYAFDLGYDESDISLEAVLRNRHVKEAKIHEVIRRHSKNVEYNRYKRIRNDVIHRGLLESSELRELQRRHVRVLMDKAFYNIRRERTGTSEPDVEQEWDEFWQQISNTARTEADKFHLHSMSTRALLNELDQIIVARVGVATTAV